jgi:hypothetical protein
MAKTKALATTSTALVNWDKELAEAAAAAKGTAAAAGGGTARISIQGGILQIDGNPVPGNELVCLVADFVMENRYFTSDFDPDNPSSPDCYAYGRELEDMGPHDDAEDKQHETCAGCPQNEWGSSDKGRGKACRNTYKLLVVPAGTLEGGRFTPPEAEDDLSGELYSLSIPPTSLKAYTAYVDAQSARLRPQWGIYTKVIVRGDKKNQVAVSFQHAGDVPTELLQAARTRNQEAARVIEVVYPKNSEREEKPAPKAKGKKRF